MSEVAVVVVGDVGHVEHVELFLTSPTSGIDWEEDRPGDEHAYDAADDHDLQQAEEEKSVQTVVVQDIGVWHGIELTEPRSKAARQAGCTLTV